MTGKCRLAYKGVVADEALFKALSPENVAPAALCLVSEDAPTNMIIGAGAGTGRNMNSVRKLPRWRELQWGEPVRGGRWTLP